MLLVVYLREPDVYTVIPEECVYKLNEKSLKTYGLNPNQNRLIFFSKEYYNKIREGIRIAFEPKFHLPVTSEYPLPDDLDETCFIAKMYSFEDTFGAAIKHCDRLRPYAAEPTYNQARLVEKPIPPTVFCERRDNETNGNDESGDFNNSDTDDVDSFDPPNNHSEELDTTFYDSGEMEPVHVYLPEQNSSVDKKPELVMNDEDNGALDDVFNGNSNDIDPNGMVEFESTRISAIASQNNLNDESCNENNKVFRRMDLEKNRFTTVENNDVVTDEQANVTQNEAENDGKDVRERQIEENLKKVLLYGEKVVVAEDVEYVHLPNEELKAMQCTPTYEVKANDMLCGNKPFKEFNGHRYFMVPSGTGFKEIGLPEKAVNGLIQMNEHSTGKKSDLRFLMAALIRFCTMGKIIENESVEADIKSLVEDILAWRAGEDVARKKSFAELFKIAIERIKEKNLNSKI